MKLNKCGAVNETLMVSTAGPTEDKEVILLAYQNSNRSK